MLVITHVQIAYTHFTRVIKMRSSI